jgi:fumarylacetoacetase
MDQTHDPSRHSWVESANRPDDDFPVQNLPFGVYRERRRNGAPRVGVAIGDCVLDIGACREAGLFFGEAAEAASSCMAQSLNAFMALGASPRRALRRRLSDVLADGAGDSDRRRAANALVPQRDVEMLLPAEIGDYTDFYASIHHATNVGRLFRPDQPLLPNYKWVPIGYHGRASSVVVSGTPVRRPSGQLQPRGGDPPQVAPCRRLDYELEMGCFIGPGNRLGERIGIERAEASMFGVCLVNDWSARDVQQWEYQPLGPFLAKSFATTISPWVVTVEALEPFRVPASPRPDGDPQPLGYLDGQANRASGGIAITLEVGLRTAAMCERGEETAWLTHADFGLMYWTFAQMLTHHASNGCNLRPGDLLASGTVSGPGAAAAGCLLELTHAGADRVALPGGDTRAFLEDGDEVILRGRCARAGFVSIGLGECRGTVAPAL